MGTVSIPNKEVSQEYINAISTELHGGSGFGGGVSKIAGGIVQMDADAVAAGIEKSSMKRYRFFNTMMKIRLVVPFILRFILHGNIIQ